MTSISGTIAEPLVRWRPATLLALVAGLALITVAGFGGYAVGAGI